MPPPNVCMQQWHDVHARTMLCTVGRWDRMCTTLLPMFAQVACLKGLILDMLFSDANPRAHTCNTENCSSFI
jgi:hypothetical protein